MLVELVQATTRDGVRLDGALQTPDGAATTSVPVDVFCLVHGTGGNFYSSALFDDFAEHLLRLGCAVLRVNTRGHDGISSAWTTRGGRRYGAAYEVVDECRHDLVAWVDWLRGRAKIGPRVGLIGHSSGALKCLYALAHEPLPDVRCVVALSPPCLSYSRFCDSPHGPEFLQTYALAEQQLNEGRPGALLDVKLPLPFAITAAGYVEKYGPDERYNLLRFVGSVPCPALITFGSQEVENNMAFRGTPEELEPLTRRHGGLHVETVPGADHFYTATRNEIVRRTVEWLRGL